MAFQVVVVMGALNGEDRHESQEGDRGEREKVFAEKLHLSLAPLNCSNLKKRHSNLTALLISMLV